VAAPPDTGQDGPGRPVHHVRQLALLQDAQGLDLKPLGDLPDLNTGKGTESSARPTWSPLAPFGPVLQGLRNPVNDLSRGALGDDSVYIFALTAIQANGPGQHKSLDLAATG